LILPSNKQHSKHTADSSKDLYSDDRISVTPSWLAVDNARYSIRTVVRLEHATIHPQLGTAYIFFFGAIILMAYSLYQFTKPALPQVVPWVMLLASVAIFIYAAAVAFRSKNRYQVVVTFIDGVKIPIITENNKQAQGLLDSLTLAMDWHRNSDIVIDAERSNYVRQAHASSSQGPSSKQNSGSQDTAQDMTTQEAAKEPVVEVSHTAPTEPMPHPSRVVRKLPPFIASMLKGRD